MSDLIWRLRIYAKYDCRTDRMREVANEAADEPERLTRLASQTEFPDNERGRADDVAALERLRAELAATQYEMQIADDLCNGEMLRAERAEAELERWRNITARKDPDDCGNGIAELFGRWKKAEAERDALRSIILWALGENGEFPARPEDWEQRKHKPWYWWRTEMRNKFDAATQRGKEQSDE